MSSSVERIQHDDVVLLFDYSPFPKSVLHFSQIDYTNKLRILIVIVDYGTGWIVPGLQMFE